jgi:hypothetical protein
VLITKFGKVIGLGYLFLLIALLYIEYRYQVKNPNWQGRQFYTEQARAIVNFSLSVKPESLPNECWIYNEKCFGYFGIFPSLIRIPFLILPWMVSSPVLFLAIAIGLGILYTIKVADLILDSRLKSKADEHASIDSRILFGIFIAVGPGTLFLQLLQPRVFWETIAWSSSLTIIGMYFFAKWFLGGVKAHKIIAVLMFVFASNTRPTGGVIAFCIGAVLLLYEILSRKGRVVTALGNFVLLSLPLISSVIIFYVKFRQFVPDMRLQEIIPENSYWRVILENNGNSTTGMKFVLSNLVGYLGLMAYRIQPDFPFLNFRQNWDFDYQFPLRLNPSMHVETHNSLTLLSPLGVLGIIMILSRLLRLFNSNKSKLREKDLIFSTLGLSALMGLIPTLILSAISNRYLGDFIPALAIGIPILAIWIVSKKDHKGIWTKLPLLFFWLAVIGALANLYTFALILLNPLEVG